MSNNKSTFSYHGLEGLDALLESDDFAGAIENGFDDPQFAKLLVLIASELRVLYNLPDEASLNVPESGEDVVPFLYELSSFLTELDCPHDSLCCGKIESRFSTVEARTLLVDFLLTELKCARLTALERLNRPSTSKDTPLASALIRAGTVLGVAAPPAATLPADFISKLAAHADARVSSVGAGRCPPLFKATLEAHRWPAIEAVARRIGHDFSLRNLYLVKRLDVTINSFLWSDEVRKKEDQILSFFKKQRARIARFNAPGMAELLAASERLLVIRAAAGVRLVHSRLHPSALADKPADRGGRTNECELPPPETFNTIFNTRRWGKTGFGGSRGGGERGNRGGRGRGRGRGGQYDNNQQRMSAEQQTRQEYEHRSRGGYNDNRGRAGFGGAQGGYGNYNDNRGRAGFGGAQGGYGNYGAQGQGGYGNQGGYYGGQGGGGGGISKLPLVGLSEMATWKVAVRHASLSLRLQAKSAAGSPLNKAIPPWAISHRVSTTSVVNRFDKIHTPQQAELVVSRLEQDERRLLHAALVQWIEGKERAAGGSSSQADEEAAITKEQSKAIFLVNGLPFIGFGCLDNMIMIVAGEYIDQSLGAWLCLSTMAAAALGNLISDVAGVGLAHYVEIGVGLAGIKHPVLTAKQLHSTRARFMTNFGRAAGLTLGCIIGMFPLLFYKSEDAKQEKKTHHKEH